MRIDHDPVPAVGRPTGAEVVPHLPFSQNPKSSKVAITVNVKQSYISATSTSCGSGRSAATARRDRVAAAEHLHAVLHVVDADRVATALPRGESAVWKLTIPSTSRRAQARVGDRARTASAAIAGGSCGEGPRTRHNQLADYGIPTESPGAT